MAISSELSSEIAVALLVAQKRSPRDLNNLKETVLKIHSILQQLTNQSGDKGQQTEVGHEQVSSDLP